MKLLFLILISLVIQGCDQPANEIEEANLHQHIKILASDEFEGRAPGSPGGEKTKLYLKKEFQIKFKKRLKNKRIVLTVENHNTN